MPDGHRAYQLFPNVAAFFQLHLRKQIQPTNWTLPLMFQIILTFSFHISSQFFSRHKLFQGYQKKDTKCRIKNGTSENMWFRRKYLSCINKQFFRGCRHLFIRRKWNEGYKVQIIRRIALNMIRKTIYIFQLISLRTVYLSIMRDPRGQKSDEKVREKNERTS